MRLAFGIVTLLAVVAASAAHAGYSEGGAFRLPQYGARGWAMGGAAVATVDDESAVSWNPAMLGRLDANRAGASYINLVPGETARQSQIVYAHVLRRAPADGAGRAVARHVVGAMATNLHLELAGGESYDENFVRLAYAFTPDHFVTFAIAGDVFFSSSDVAGFDAVGSSVDFGVRLMLTEHVNVGLVARNAFSRYSYDDGQDYDKARSFTAGVAYNSLPYATIEGDVVFEYGDLARAIAGVETDYIFDLLSLRGGFAHIDTGGSRGVPYLGFGVRALRDRLFIHYNANMDDEKAFEDTHRFTLSVRM
jgi:hypothetical protein